MEVNQVEFIWKLLLNSSIHPVQLFWISPLGNVLLN